MAEDYSDLMEAAKAIPDDDYSDLIQASKSLPANNLPVGLPNKAEELSSFLKRLTAKTDKDANVHQYATGLGKPAALLEALFGGKLGEEYDAQRAELNKTPPQDIVDSVERTVWDPITAALKTVPSLYEKNVHQKMNDYEALPDVDKAIIGTTGAVASPLNKFGAAEGLVSKIPMVGKLLAPAVGGAAQGLAYNAAMSDPSESSNPIQSMEAGAAMNTAAAALPPIAKAVGKVAGPVVQYPQRIAEAVLGKFGGSRFGKAIIPEEKLRSTGSKLTNELRQKMSSFGGKLEGTDLSPDMTLGEVWQDPLMKENFLKSVQKVMSSRQRDAYSIPIRDLDESISRRISSDDTALMGTIDDFLSGKLLMTPKQRAEYFKLDAEWPDVAITDPRFSQAQEAIKGMLGDVEAGKLNMNLEDVAKFGQGARTADIAGMKFNVTPDMKAMGGAQVRGETMDRFAARQALANIVRGRQMATEAPVIGWPIKAAMGTVDMLGSIGQRIERVMTPSKAAQKIVKDPNQLMQMAQSDREVGTIAKSVLQDLHQGNQSAAAAKAFLFATTPGFRKMFLGQDDEQNRKNGHSQVDLTTSP